MRGKRATQLLALVSTFAVFAIYIIFFIPEEQKGKEPWGQGMEVLAAMTEHGVTQISLQQDGSQVLGDGASVSNNRILIVQGGAYRVSGTLEEGQIYIESKDKEAVTLILAGVEIHNANEAAVYIKNAKETRIVLEEGSENFLQSGDGDAEDSNAGDSNAGDSNASKAALYSRDDLTILGEGTLTVQGYGNNGIHTTDHLVLEGGTILVEAKNHGIKGKDALTVSGGTLSVEAQQDALHSDDRIEIAGGALTLLAGDDGIHADKELVVSDGSIEILESYEGLEANQIQIQGGDIWITSSDDGINASGGESQGMPVMESTNLEIAEEAFPELCITGGTIYMNAEGDGLDSNGNLRIEGGIVVVDGPSGNGNGALDSGAENGGVCEINGGTVIALGSSGMAETFGESSSQYSFQYSFEKAFAAGDEIVIADSEGRELYRYTATKEGSSVVFSCPEMTEGMICHLQAGEQSAEIVLDSVSTSAGRTSGGMFGHPGGGMERGPGGRNMDGEKPGGERPKEERPEGERPE